MFVLTICGFVPVCSIRSLIILFEAPESNKTRQSRPDGRSCIAPTRASVDATEQSSGIG